MTGTDPTAGLPPMPGPTGDPRPPEPPLHDVPRRLGTIVTHVDPGDTAPQWHLGPADQPPLELAVVHPAERFKEALFITSFYAAMILLVCVLPGWWWGGYDLWLTLKVVGVCLVLLCGWFWKINDCHGWAVAGGTWLAAGGGRRPRRPRHRAAVVCLYTLARVQVDYGRGIDTEPAHDVLVLCLTQKNPVPAVVGVDVSVLEANPALWALVYNGILHSEARGAVINDRTREFLHLDPN